MEWGTELSLLRELSSQRSITLVGGLYGATNVNDVVGTYRILARYRRNFWRPWLFYELEPELFWSRRDDRNYPTNYALTLRLEVILQGKEP
jgi:hypothetical protein